MGYNVKVIKGEEVITEYKDMEYSAAIQFREIWANTSESVRDYSVIIEEISCQLLV